MVKYKLYAGYKLKSDAKMRAKDFRKKGNTARIRKTKKYGYGIYSNTLKR